ncbi:hypothetical protein GQ55_5G422400 [Panicum hallii var. hallii]|uniref:Uncharacterized protein n=1 Tax=Panicum hallii var. hallii TaxID=1504633 RepID=A0A2T7DP54_9POAL|nr:hypothetical protein GQ55_5G422400 [Panicum hallii var. hallii]
MGNMGRPSLCFFIFRSPTGPHGQIRDPPRPDSISGGLPTEGKSPSPRSPASMGIFANLSCRPTAARCRCF